MALLNKLVALEEFDTDMDGVSEPDNIAEATEVESSLIEAQENEEELNDMEADLEVAEDAEEALEELIVSLEAAVERGGMDRHEARLYNLNRKTIYGMMGQKIDRHRQVSIESFSGASSRLTATKIALEEEKGTFTKWWEAIVRFIKQAAAKAVDFVIGIFSSIQALQNRAQTLLKSANDSGAKFEGKLKDSQKEKYGKIFRGPGIEEKVLNMEEVINHIRGEINKGKELPKATADINRIGKTMQETLREYDKKLREAGITTSVTKHESSHDVKTTTGKKAKTNTIAHNVQLELETSFGKLNMEFDEAAEIWKGVDASSQELEKIKGAEGSGDSNNTVDYKVLTKCVGGFLLVKKTVDKKIDEKSPQAEGAKDVSASLAFINAGKFEEKKEHKFNEEELNDANCKSTLKAIIGFCKDLRNIGNYIKDYNKAFQKQSEDMSSKASSITEKAMSGLRKIGNMLKSLFTATNGLSKWYKYLITLCKDVLNVISIRMSNAPGEEKSDKKDPEKPAETPAGDNTSTPAAAAS